jgi:hypothetical protein
MTVRKTTKKRISKKVKSNPKIWDYLTGAKKSSIEPGAYPFKVTDGVIILKGEKVASSLSEIDAMFSSRLKNLQIEFEPYNTGKRYVLNKEESSRRSSISDDDDDNDSARRRHMEHLARQAKGRINK